MNQKISSDLTLLFKWAWTIQLVFSTIASILFILLDLNIISIIIFTIILIFWRISFVIGIFYLKSIEKTDRGILVDKLEIDFNQILKLKQTFLFYSHPYRIDYKDQNTIKSIYFLPKSKSFFSLNLSEHKVITDLKTTIKKQNSNT